MQAQEKMMKNEDRNLNKSPEQELNIEVESFTKKNEYQYFLSYKGYLSRLIFKNSS